jgi:hypothetical protein
MAWPNVPVGVYQLAPVITMGPRREGQKKSLLGVLMAVI